MKQNIYYCLLIMHIFFNSACNESKKKEQIIPDTITTDSTPLITDQHNSSNSLDWDGTYKGTLPCADCEGIATEIALNKDLTFSIKTSYLGKPYKANEEKGSFTWNGTGNTITLTGIANKPNKYFVGENKLLQLDMSGNKITGNLADKYVLIKQQK